MMYINGLCYFYLNDMTSKVIVGCEEYLLCETQSTFILSFRKYTWEIVSCCSFDTSAFLDFKTSHHNIVDRQLLMYFEVVNIK